MAKAQEKGAEWLGKELARLEKMLEGGAMSAQKVGGRAGGRGGLLCA